MGFSPRKLAGGAGLLIVAFAAAPSAAQGLGGLGATHVYGPAAGQMATRPSDAEVMAAWPAAAKAKGLAGSAVMRCVTEAEALANCQVVLERNHAGFGQALLSLAPTYRLRRVPEGQRSDGAVVVVTATWPAPETPVDWVVEPKPGDFSTSLTQAAWRAGGEGQAVMNCLVARMGAMHDCTVVYQNPPGKGFGAMALRFQGLLKLKPATVAGRPIEIGEDIVFNFRALRPGEVP